MAKKILLAAVFALGFGIVAMAQPPFDPMNPNPEGIPVDGGASLLLASGVAYGLKRIKGNKAEEKKA